MEKDELLASTLFERRARRNVHEYIMRVRHEFETWHRILVDMEIDCPSCGTYRGLVFRWHAFPEHSEWKCQYLNCNYKLPAALSPPNSDELRRFFEEEAWRARQKEIQRFYASLAKSGIDIPENLECLSIPDAFLRFAEVYCQKKTREIQELIQKGDAREKKIRLRKEEWLGNGIPFAERIFLWANRFRSSEVFVRLLHIGGHAPYFSVQGLYFFDGRIEGLSWCGLGVTEQGIWWKRDGCGTTENLVATPQDLARQVEPPILEEACKWIDDGRVWECIQNRLEWRR